MNSIYFLSDIHGNLNALQAVIEAIGKEEFQHSQKYFLGDYVNFGPQSNEVIEVLRNLEKADFIEGNHDIYCSKTELDYKTKYAENLPYMVKHIDWIKNRVNGENLNWLKKLNRTREFELSKKKFLLFHGYFEDTESKVDLTDPNLQKYDYILCGHSHKPGIWQLGNTTLINVGSVGSSLDGDNRASYCTMTQKNNEFRFEIKRVKYNVEKTILKLMELAPPYTEEIIWSLTHGKKKK